MHYFHSLQGASSISEPEQQGVSKEVNLLGKVRDFAKALEMTSDSVPETVQNDPAKLMKQWCPSMDTQARSHLVHHLKGIGLKETAHR